jgi:hypothetical protein
MRLFWTFWVIDFIAALVILYFFVIGIMDGSVSSFNAGEWALILFIVAGVLTGSFYFIKKGKKAVAYVLLSLLAIPAFFMVIFMLIMLFGDVHWQ